MMRRALAIALISCNSTPSVPLCTDPASPHTRPPAKPNVPVAAGNETITFAIDSLLLGDSRRGEVTTSTTAWEGFGFDIDNHVTKSCALDEVCRGAQLEPLVDAPGGIDNTFGAQLLPFFFVGEDHPSLAVSKNIRHGVFTLQIRIRGFLETATEVEVDIFPSHTFDRSGVYPTFTPTEDWPVRDDGLAVGTTIERAKQHFTAYVVNGTLVIAGVDLTLGLVSPTGIPVDLPLHAAILSMQVSGDIGNNGTIAGVVGRDDMALAMSTVGRCSHSLSPSPLSLASDTVDILIDGNNKPKVPCNAISIGMGFTAKRIANPMRVAPPLMQPICPVKDAGVDVETDDGGTEAGDAAIDASSDALDGSDATD